MIPKVIAVCLVTWARRNFELGGWKLPRLNPPYWRAY
jgi:hypothetical protein